eukprot:gnl/TRDRNA2_/TRDRNA2_129702_c0_seq2.p1 gnl/TRDRNA2_/TRDRNA2_129702_c0~~gnl/TRDRNA2_/TRDRNA2_129702_c0_seq2.p1  ORF type:complete len:584 (-),score=83.78 gnl/TRDRNA2_/TRDRNA2_129702_c0_seq2:57-1745(-)
MAVFGRPLVHTPRGQWAASTALRLASRECWPTLGTEEQGWPVTYHEVMELALDAEAWQEYGDEAEYRRPPLHAMPPPLLDELTPSVAGSRRRLGRGWQPRARHVTEESRPDSSSASSPRRVLRVLSTGNHASYPAMLFALWRSLLSEYEFELEDQSFDTRYCELAGTCSVDERFSWLGEHLRSTIVETCGGLYLKGFENIGALSEQLFGLLTAGPDAPAAQADVLLCTHPPYSCRLFWPVVQRRAKPLLGFFGGTLEAHVPGVGMRQWLFDFREMASHPRVQFAAISPFISEKMRYQARVDIPATRGYGFHVTEPGVTYLPTRSREALVWKNSNECEDNRATFDGLLQTLAEQAAASSGVEPLRFPHLRDLREMDDASYATIASFRAIVFVPYEVLLMSFYELYHVGIPLFVPRPELAVFFAYRGPVTYPHCDLVLREEDVHATESMGLDHVPYSNGQANDEMRTLRARQRHERPRAPYSPFNRDQATVRLAWLQAYSDWYRFPHIQLYSALPELIQSLDTVNLQAVSAGMRHETERSLRGSAAFWKRAFAKVLGESDNDGG